MHELHLQPYKYVLGYGKVSFSVPCTTDHAKELHYSHDFSNASHTCMLIIWNRNLIMLKWLRIVSQFHLHKKRVGCCNSIYQDIRNVEHLTQKYMYNIFIMLHVSLCVKSL